MSPELLSFKQKVVKELADQFSSWGYTDIRSQHLLDKYQSTREISGFRPDMTFKKQNVLFIVEAQRRESLDDKELIEKWLAFSEAIKNTKSCFWVFVPPGQREEFILKTNELRIEASVHEIEMD
ncbi:MAG: hypothetical protein HQL77_18225 [Magnetococcales bacterium]|nr:hypothetical protein [Magnetococcales bacterium]